MFRVREVIKKWYLDGGIIRENKGLPRIFALVLAGVVLVIFSTGGSSEERDGTKNSAVGTLTQNTESVSDVSDDESTWSAAEQYVKRQEIKLQEILEKVEGVGAVEVMLTIASEENEKSTSLWTTQTDTGTANIAGVVVVAQGAGTGKVDTEITAAVQALFSIDSHKISVMQMK